MNKLIVAAALSLTMSSCGIYKKYTRPEVKTDGLFGEAVTIEDTTSLATKHWNEIFTDASLQLLIEKGLTNNVNLAVAKLNVEQSRAMLSTAKLAYLPTFMLTPQGGMSSIGGSKANYTYQLPLAASWEADLFGKIHNKKEQAEASLEQSEVYVQAVQTTLVASIANSYYTLLMLDEQMRITEQTLQLWNENLRVMQAMKRAGLQTEASVAQSEANCKAIESSFADLKKQIQTVENSLSLLLKEPQHSIKRGVLAQQQLPKSLSVGLPVQLLAERPDVKRAELAMKQNHYGVNVARAAFYPSVTLSGTAGWNNNIGVISNPASFLLSAGASLVQPVFNKGLNRANLKIAKAQYEQSLLNFQQTLLNAGGEVNSALAQNQSATTKREIRSNQVAALERAVKSATLLMQNTNSTYLEVLTAQQSLLQAQLLQVSDWFEEAQSIVLLYQALGGGK